MLKFTLFIIFLLFNSRIALSMGGFNVSYFKVSPVSGKDQILKQVSRFRVKGYDITSYKINSINKCKFQIVKPLEIQKLFNLFSQSSTFQLTIDDLSNHKEEISYIKKCQKDLSLFIMWSGSRGSSNQAGGPYFLNSSSVWGTHFFITSTNVNPSKLENENFASAQLNMIGEKVYLNIELYDLIQNGDKFFSNSEINKTQIKKFELNNLDTSNYFNLSELFEVSFFIGE